MRRALAAAAVTVVTVTACATGPGVASTLPAGASRVSATATPVPVDPAVNRQVCAAAASAAGKGVRDFNVELAALERAAARGDQHAVVDSAEVILDQLTGLAATLRRLAQRAVSPSVRAALGRASATLGSIASESYAGSPADIRKALVGLAGSFTRACR